MTDYGGSKTPKNERDYWQTPIDIFNALDREFGFWLDAAASESNALSGTSFAGLVTDWYPDNRIHECPPSDERANIRSATPLGFAKAVFLSNAPHLNKKREAA